ncbi:hypothetical protein H4Q26_018143 [Puccinia striiformis f. sp. tritici PST-130]|nr:hypothetical protein Pst134EB_010821 [Puccinia striiformis f. sp. tritici]KAI9628231.1 hypothetical protein H4Q26_018143 [Puccinia striiformis f. sp. tritici PST-130]
MKAVQISMVSILVLLQWLSPATGTYNNNNNIGQSNPFVHPGPPPRLPDCPPNCNCYRDPDAPETLMKVCQPYK